jgi:hypothetical protein
VTGVAQVQGADNLVRSLQDAVAALSDLSATEDQAGQLLTQDAQSASPVDTGRMAAAHGYEVTGTTVAVTVATPYAVFVNAREGWFTDTITADADQVVGLYSDAVHAAVDLVKGI